MQPHLTQYELFFVSAIKIGMNTNDIAQLFNISNDSVRKSRYRIKKRFGLKKEDNFLNLLQSITSRKMAENVIIICLQFVSHKIRIDNQFLANFVLQQQFYKSRIRISSKPEDFTASTSSGLFFIIKEFLCSNIKSLNCMSFKRRE